MALDPEAIRWIMAVICGALAGGYFSYRSAVKDAKKKIQEAFQEHITLLHAEHKETVQAASLKKER